jgi:hypothetical protein
LPANACWIRQTLAIGKWKQKGPLSNFHLMIKEYNRIF